MLHNVIIILTFFWSLHYAQLHDKCDDFDFSYGQFPIFKYTYSGILCIWCLCWYVMLGFVRNMKLFCWEDLFWFQSYWVSDLIHGNFRLLLGDCKVVLQTLFTNVILRCHIYFRFYSPTMIYYFWVNSDKCHMWGRKCSCFLKHPISLPLGSSRNT